MCDSFPFHELEKTTTKSSQKKEKKQQKMCLLIFVFISFRFYCFSEWTANQVNIKRKVREQKEKREREKKDTKEIKIPTFARLVIQSNISSS